MASRPWASSWRRAKLVAVAEAIDDLAPVAFIRDGIIARQRVNIALDGLAVDVEEVGQFLLRMRALREQERKMQHAFGQFATVRHQRFSGQPSACRY